MAEDDPKLDPERALGTEVQVLPAETPRPWDHEGAAPVKVAPGQKSAEPAAFDAGRI